MSEQEFCDDCEVWFGSFDVDEPSVHLCPLHASAPQLKALNKQLVKALEGVIRWAKDRNANNEFPQAETALAAAKEME